LPPPAAIAIIASTPGAKESAMRHASAAFFALVLLAGCSGGGSDADDSSAAAAKGITGPFPQTVQGTIGSSYPLEDGSGLIRLDLLEYEHASILVTEATYQAKGMEEDDAEVTLSVEPLPKEKCGDDAEQCFKGS
jgi:hypothetical protein